MQTQTLPIDAILPSLVDGLTTHNTCILQAEPGAGKSTRVPLALMQQPWAQQGKILMLEPRRVAAVSLAHFLAQQCGEKVGDSIGYRVRQDNRVGPTTRLEIITDGILVRMLLDDPELADVAAILFDEFHERSLQADMALLFAREVQQSLRPDLRLLVMSATLDVQPLADYLAPAKVLNCPGRAYPVEVLYQADKVTRLSDAVCTAVRRLWQLTTGDILVFLPGRGEIAQSVSALQEIFSPDDAEVLALHASLPLSAQREVLAPRQRLRRRVICSTNIAETSLTVEGITGVVDAGLERVSTYDPNSGMSRLVTTRISQASSIQRAGRAGRTQPGHCIRLWPSSQQTSLTPHRAPEISRTELADVVLSLAQWGIHDVTGVSWLTSPPTAAFHSSQQLLASLGILTAQFKLTAMGKRLTQFALHPRLALMIVRAVHTPYLRTACELATLLSDANSYKDWNSTDITGRLYLARNSGASSSKRRFTDSVTALMQQARLLPNDMTLAFLNTPLSEDDVVAVLLWVAFPERLAQKREDGEGRYLLAQGKGVHLASSDPLAKSRFLLVAEADVRQQDGRIFSAAALSDTTAQRLLTSYCKDQPVYWFDEKSQRYRGEQQRCYHSLIIQRSGAIEVPQSFIQQHLSQQLAERGVALLHWHPSLAGWWARLEWLGKIDPDTPQWTTEKLLGCADEWLFPYLGQIKSLAELRQRDVFPLVKGLLDWSQQQRLEVLAPANYMSKTGKSFAINYEREAGPIVSVPLQEMFGEPESPLLAGRVPLTFDLLSPARRTLQITSDLAHFWKNAYIEVAKEMRSRYPKHRWPDNPEQAVAGHSLKGR